MSALERITDFRQTLRLVRKVPTADSCSAEGSLFNHLVGAAEQRRRDIDAERLDLREHRNATGLQPGGLQWVVISGHC